MNREAMRRILEESKNMEERHPKARPDVRLDWQAIAEVAASGDSPAANRGRSSLLRPVVPTPRETLNHLLDKWEMLAATPGTHAEQTELADRILDLFAAHPGQAPGWQEAWQRIHKRTEEKRQ